MLSVASDAAKETGKRVVEVILDPVAQAPRAASTDLYVVVAAIVGATGIAIVAAPAVVALPALGAVGFSASGPVASAFGELVFQIRKEGLKTGRSFLC